MFEHCETLLELNKERQAQVAAGVQITEVNAAYNKARRRLQEEMPNFRRIPSYTAQSKDAVLHIPMPFIKGKGKPNEIIITKEGVLL